MHTVHNCVAHRVTADCLFVYQNYCILRCAYTRNIKISEAKRSPRGRTRVLLPVLPIGYVQYAVELICTIDTYYVINKEYMEIKTSNTNTHHVPQNINKSYN